MKQPGSCILMCVSLLQSDTPNAYATEMKEEFPRLREGFPSRNKI